MNSRTCGCKSSPDHAPHTPVFDCSKERLVCCAGRFSTKHQFHWVDGESSDRGWSEQQFWILEFSSLSAGWRFESQTRQKSGFFMFFKNPFFQAKRLVWVRSWMKMAAGKSRTLSSDFAAAEHVTSLFSSQVRFHKAYRCVMMSLFANRTLRRYGCVFVDCVRRRVGSLLSCGELLLFWPCWWSVRWISSSWMLLSFWTRVFTRWWWFTEELWLNIDRWSMRVLNLSSKKRNWRTREVTFLFLG